MLAGFVQAGRVTIRKCLHQPARSKRRYICLGGLVAINAGVVALNQRTIER